MDIRYFATSNPNKVREASAILGSDLEQVSLDLLEPQAVDVAEVIREKAEDAYRQAGKPILVEDASLEFLAWRGLPGALVKWFLDTVGLVGMLKMLGEETDRRAVAKAAVGFFDGTEAHVFIGEVPGTIAKEPRGTGFGWDPIFIPDGSDRSYGETAADEKNAISHRRKAWDQLRDSMDRN